MGSDFSIVWLLAGIALISLVCHAAGMTGALLIAAIVSLVIYVAWLGYIAFRH